MIAALIVTMVVAAGNAPPPRVAFDGGFGQEQLGGSLLPPLWTFAASGRWLRSSTAVGAKATFGGRAYGSRYVYGEVRAASLFVTHEARREAGPLSLALGYEAGVTRLRQDLGLSTAFEFTERTSWAPCVAVVGRAERAFTRNLFLRVEGALPLRLLKVGDEEAIARARWVVGWRALVAAGVAF